MFVGLLLVGFLFTSGAAAQVDDTATTTTPWFTAETIANDDIVLGDFVVGPGKVEISVPPGTSETVWLTVTNRIGKPHRFNVAVEDMVGSQDPSKTVDLLGGAVGPYSVQDYIRVPGATLTLEHNERARIPVTITVPPSASPGGHYGSVLVDTVAVEPDTSVQDSLAPQSPIVARVGTLFFITVPGEIERAGQLVDFTTVPDQSWFQATPITFGITFVNNGSVHLSPYGFLSITNMFGQEVGAVELDPWFVLPEAERFREVVWNGGHHIGRYTATLTVHRGYDDETDVLQVSFWIIPWQLLLGIFVGVFVLVFLIRSFFARFEFRRRV